MASDNTGHAANYSHQSLKAIRATIFDNQARILLRLPSIELRQYSAMYAKPLLTADERDYIQHILGKSLINSAFTAPTFRVDGGTAANSLLAGLGKNAALHLDADFGNEHLRFPLLLVEDEFHAMHLELGAPQIFQSGPVERLWRVKLDQPLRLTQDNGQASDLCLRELSAGGALIESASQQPLPEQFKLWLPVDNQEPILLWGHQVRSSDRRLTAFRFEQLAGSHHERLQQFIFQQHRLLSQAPDKRSA